MVNIIRRVKNLNNDDKILRALDRIQRDIDSIKLAISSNTTIQNNNLGTFKTIVRSVDSTQENKASGSSRLEGNIETI
jgi:hypothetical protein